MSFDHSASWSEEIICAYAAGFIDGEGYIGIHRNGKRSARRSTSYFPKLSIGQSEQRWHILDWLIGIFPGGSLHGPYQGPGLNRARRKLASWQYEPAIAAIIRVQPYLLLKVTQAQLVCDFQKAKRQSPRGSSGMKTFADRCYKECCFLNRTGPEIPALQVVKHVDDVSLFG